MQASWPSLASWLKSSSTEATLCDVALICGMFELLAHRALFRVTKRTRTRGTTGILAAKGRSRRHFRGRLPNSTTHCESSTPARVLPMRVGNSLSAVRSGRPVRPCVQAVRSGRRHKRRLVVFYLQCVHPRSNMVRSLVRIQGPNTISV
jgi:hypothetical protein